MTHAKTFPHGHPHLADTATFDDVASPPAHRAIRRTAVRTPHVIDLLISPPLRLMAAPPRIPTLLAKRLVDLVAAMTLLVLVSPLLALLAISIRCDSRGPALYSQTRIGRYGTPFRCWKFRTMVVDADHRLQALLASHPEARREFEATRKLVQDPRITRLGDVLRRSSLDELPQLWNVVRGEMSLVGPRPVVPDELPWYGDAVGVVLAAKPGITGAWQISGRNDVSYERRVALDVDYARRHTLAGDVRILLSTVRVVATARGAY